MSFPRALLVLGLFLGSFLFFGDVAKAEELTISAAYVNDFDGAVQYLDASIINTGTLHFRVEATADPGDVIAVAPNGNEYEASPSWEEIEPGIWQGEMYMPTGWERLWLKNAPNLLWEHGWGPWEVSEDGVGVYLTEPVTYPTIEVEARVRQNGRGAVRTVYIVRVTPLWAQQDLIYYGAFTGLQVETTCEGQGHFNDGSFLWNFDPTGRLRGVNKVRPRFLADPPLMEGTYNLLRWDGTTLRSGTTTVPACTTG